MAVALMTNTLSWLTFLVTLLDQTSYRAFQLLRIPETASNQANPRGITNCFFELNNKAATRT